MKRLVLLAALLFAGVGAARPAEASMKYCNGTNTTIWTLFSWWSGCTEGTGWSIAGWWQLSPGQCKTVSTIDLDYNSVYYYYAETANMTRVWGGPFPSCVSNNAFNWCEGTCSTNSSTVGWGELHTSGESNITLRFQ